MSRTLTANIRERRGDLVDIKVPIYVDKHTVLPSGTSAPESNGHIGEYLSLDCGLSLICQSPPNPDLPHHTSRWTPWHSEWDVAVSKSLSKLGT
jgi:hypothetical protein